MINGQRFAPVAGLALLAGGQFLFGHRSGTLAATEALGREPLSALPWLLAVAAGGVVLAFGLPHRRK